MWTSSACWWLQREPRAAPLSHPFRTEFPSSSTYIRLAFFFFFFSQIFFIYLSPTHSINAYECCIYLSDLGVGCIGWWDTESRCNAWDAAGTRPTRNKVASAKHWRKIWRHNLLCCPCGFLRGGYFLSTDLPQDPDRFQKILWLPWKLWKVN